MISKALKAVVTTLAICAADSMDDTEDSTTLTFSTYNTYQFYSAEGRSERLELQIEELATTYSDSDVVCLQELYFLTDKQTVIEGVSSIYPYTASEIDTMSSEEKDLPRIACEIPSNDDGTRAAAIDAINSECFASCGTYYGLSEENTEFSVCLLSQCTNEFIAARGDECSWCVFFMGALLDSYGLETTYQNAIYVCSNYELAFNFMFQDDTVILSKYPIVNRYFFELSDANVIASPTALNVVEINVGGEENVFVGCTHITSVSEGIPFFSFDPSIQSLEELAVAQIQGALDIINEGGIETYVRDFNLFVWMGDFNVGQLEPYGFSDIFSIVSENGFTDLPDLVFKNKKSDYDVLCTWCADITRDDYNGLAEGDLEINNDFDHILVRLDGYQYDPIVIDAERIFLERFELNSIDTDNLLPLSDHYGLMLTLKIEEKENDDDTDSASSDN